MSMGHQDLRAIFWSWWKQSLTACKMGGRVSNFNCTWTGHPAIIYVVFLAYPDFSNCAERSEEGFLWILSCLMLVEGLLDFYANTQQASGGSTALMSSLCCGFWAFWFLISRKWLLLYENWFRARGLWRCFILISNLKEMTWELIQSQMSLTVFHFDF